MRAAAAAGGEGGEEAAKDDASGAGPGGMSAVKTYKLVLIDLGGSEKLKRSQADKDIKGPGELILLHFYPAQSHSHR